MKVLKVVLVSFAVILLILFIGLYFVIKSVDVNKYVPEITAQISKAIGREVKTGKAGLTLSFNQGVLLELNALSIADDPKFSEKSFLTIDRVVFGVDLKAILLERKLVVSEVTIASPKVVIIRNKNGLINAATIGAVAKADPKAGTQEASSSSSTSLQAAALPALMVSKIAVVDGDVSFIDETFDPKLVVHVEKLEVGIRDLSLTDPFMFTVKAALFSSGQNIMITGQAGLDIAHLGAKLVDVKLTTDLAKISLEQLNASLPMLKAAGLQDPLKGVFEVVVPEVVVSAQGLESLKANAELSQGFLISSLIPFPVENVAMKVVADQKQIDIKSLDCILSGGKVHVQGTVEDYLAEPVIDLTGNADGIEPRKISEAYKLPVSVTGKIAATFKAKMVGKTSEAIMASLQCEAKGDLKEGALEGLNVLEQGLNNISMLTGLWEMVQADLPSETQDDLKKGATQIQKCEFEVTAQNGLVNINKADLMARDFAASVKGTVKLIQSVDIKADLYIAKKVSGVLVSKVKDLGVLYDAEDRIYIPILVTGALMQPKVNADMEYLTQKLAVNKGKEALQKVLDKNPEVQGVLNAVFGGKSQGEGQGTSSQGQEGAAQGNQGQPAEPVSADQAVDAIFNMFKKK